MYVKIRPKKRNKEKPPMGHHTIYEVCTLYTHQADNSTFTVDTAEEPHGNKRTFKSTWQIGKTPVTENSRLTYAATLLPG